MATRQGIMEAAKCRIEAAILEEHGLPLHANTLRVAADMYALGTDPDLIDRIAQTGRDAIPTHTWEGDYDYALAASLFDAALAHVNQLALDLEGTP